MRRRGFRTISRIKRNFNSEGRRVSCPAPADHAATSSVTLCRSSRASFRTSRSLSVVTPLADSDDESLGSCGSVDASGVCGLRAISWSSASSTSSVASAVSAGFNFVKPRSFSCSRRSRARPKRSRFPCASGAISAGDRSLTKYLENEQNKSNASSFASGSSLSFSRRRSPVALGRICWNASSSNGSWTIALLEMAGPGEPKTAMGRLPALQVLTLHLGLVAVGLLQEEDELGFVRLSAAQPFAESLQLGFRGPELAQELDRTHRPIPCVFEALEVREGDLERVHDLPSPLVVGVRDVQDHAPDHRLRSRVVPP